MTMDDGSFNIKEVCRQCEHWLKESDLKGRCPQLGKAENVQVAPDLEAVHYYTAPDFGCVLFEPDPKRSSFDGGR